MNAKQRRTNQRIYTKLIAPDLIVMRPLGGSPKLAEGFGSYTPAHTSTY